MDPSLTVLLEERHSAFHPVQDSRKKREKPESSVVKVKIHAASSKVASFEDRPQLRRVSEDKALESVLKTNEVFFQVAEVKEGLQVSPLQPSCTPVANAHTALSRNMPLHAFLQLDDGIMGEDAEVSRLTSASDHIESAQNRQTPPTAPSCLALDFCRKVNVVTPVQIQAP